MTPKPYYPLFIFTVLTCFLMIGCQDDSNLATVIQGYDESSKSETIPRLHADFIKLSDEVSIDLVYNVYIVNEQLVVSTNRGVYCFDMEGNYIREISCKGRADNEWLTIGPLTVDYDNGTLKIYDTSSRKVLQYTVEGEFLGSYPFPDRLFTIHQAESLSDNRTVFAHGIFKDSGVIYSFEDSTQKVISSFKTKVSTKGTVERIGKHPLSVFEDEIKVVFPFDNKVYNIKDNQLSPCYIINTGKKLLTGEKLKQINDFSFNEYLVESEKGYFVGPNNVFENKTHILLSFFDISFILIEKQSGEVTCFNSGAGKQLENLPPIGLLNTSADYFVGVVDILKAQSLAANIPNNCQDDALLRIKAISTAPIDSNPVIVLYRY